MINENFFTDNNYAPEKAYTQKYAGIVPTAINEEMKWDKRETIISTTDRWGTITFANDIFCQVSGYTRQELIGQPHNIVRHPDMPKIVFKVMWDSILRGENFHGIVKNIAKSGKYYWVITNFSISKDGDGNITSFMARRNSIPKEVITEYIEPLYNKLLQVEQVGGIVASGNFVNNYLKRMGKSYPLLIYEIMKECGADMDLVSDSVAFGKNPFEL